MTDSTLGMRIAAAQRLVEHYLVERDRLTTALRDAWEELRQLTAAQHRDLCMLRDRIQESGAGIAAGSALEIVYDSAFDCDEE